MVHVAEDPSQTPSAAPPRPGQSVSTADPENVQFRTADLVSGKQLNCPIYDKSGLLLLAQGSLITARFKQLLEQRGIRDVMLSRADAQAMIGSIVVSEGKTSGATLDCNVVAKLDDMIKSGKLFIADAGPKFKDRLITRGCKGFNQEQRNELAARHTETCSLLDDMIRAAANGESMNGGDIATVVSDYLTHLTADVDCVVDVAAHSRDFVGIGQHCLQTALMAMAMAIEMGMTEETIRVIGICGMVHDWGMTLVPPQIRNSNRVLNKIEFLEITKHPMYTVNLLQRVWGLPPQVPSICYQVHERPNGTGYPQGRQGKAIHPSALVLGVADSYVALASQRPNRPALKPYAAVECLLRMAGEKMVDADAARALLNILSQFPIGSLVQLTDGSKARVLRRNGGHYNMPIVQILKKADGTLVDPRDESSVIDPANSCLKIVRALPTPGRNQIDLDPATLYVKRD